MIMYAIPMYAHFFKVFKYIAFSILVFTFILFSLPFVHAQEQLTTPSTSTDTEPISKQEIQLEIDNETYFITNIQYLITGFVTEAGLETKLSMKTGKRTFTSRTQLLNYIQIKEIELKNLRQLKNSSTIIASYEWSPENNRYDVVLKVFIVIDNTLLILPYFTYSTNSGFLLSGRARDYNFLGSLETLSVNLDYRFDNNSKNQIGLNFGFSYPFLYKKNIFTLGITEGFTYRSDEKITHDNTLRFDYRYSITDLITFSSYIKQEFSSATNETLADKPIYSHGQNNIDAGLSFALNKTSIPIVGTMFYSPKTYFSAKYSLTPNDPMPSDRKATSIGLAHSFTLGRIDWIGNFRQGLSATLGNNNTYSFDDTGWHHDIYFETKLHANKWDRLGFNMRLYTVYNLYNYPNPATENDKGSSIGDRLRGVIDNNFTNVRTGLVINTSIFARLFEIPPIASFHLGIGFDVGVRQHMTHAFNVDQDVKYTLSLEGLAFALFSRSVVIRASYGIDIGRAIQEKTLTFANKEIFIGLSLYY